MQIQKVAIFDSYRKIITLKNNKKIEVRLLAIIFRRKPIPPFIFRDHSL